MHNLFTPVEVIRNTSHSYPPEALLRFEQELYAITQPRILSLADERKKLLVWYDHFNAGSEDYLSYSVDMLPLLIHHSLHVCWAVFSRSGRWHPRP